MKLINSVSKEKIKYFIIDNAQENKNEIDILKRKYILMNSNIRKIQKELLKDSDNNMKFLLIEHEKKMQAIVQAMIKEGFEVHLYRN